MKQKFFISYNSADRKWAHWIALTLKDAGHEVAVHDWEIPVGGNVPLWMNSKLVWADRLIAVISPDYVPASWASRVWDPEGINPEGKGGSLIPVIVRPTSKMPPTLKGLRTIDLTKCSEDEARSRLISGVRFLPGVEEPPESQHAGPAEKPNLGPVVGEAAPRWVKASDGTPMISLFISYAHADENLKGRFLVHLRALQREGLIGVWHDQMLRPGEHLDRAIEAKLAAAELVVLLISPDFINSDYCTEKEMQRAFARAKDGRCKVVAVILKDCRWRDIPIGEQGGRLGDFVALPPDGKPVIRNREKALDSVVAGIRRLIKDESAPGPVVQSTGVSAVTTGRAGVGQPTDAVAARSQKRERTPADETSVKDAYARMQRVLSRLDGSSDHITVDGRPIEPRLEDYYKPYLAIAKYVSANPGNIRGAFDKIWEHGGPSRVFTSDTEAFEAVVAGFIHQWEDAAR